MSTEEQYGTVLLECRWRMKFSLMLAVVGALIASGFTYLLFFSGSRDLRGNVFLQILVGLMVLLSYYATFVGVRNTIAPPLILTATTQGLLIFTDGNVTLKSPVFIEWKQIERLELVKHRGADASGRTRKFETIAAHLRESGVPGEGISLTTLLSEKLGRNFRAEEKLLHLDATTGNPHGVDLLDRLQMFRTKYSGL